MRTVWISLQVPVQNFSSNVDVYSLEGKRGKDEMEYEKTHVANRPP